MKALLASLVTMATTIAVSIWGRASAETVMGIVAPRTGAIAQAVVD
jgi:hypothetical protein